jgi:hypothetical protein
MQTHLISCHVIASQPRSGILRKRAWQSRFSWDCFVGLLFAMTARAGTSMEMTEIYRSIFKTIFTKNAMRNVKVAIPKLTIAISENLFQNEISLATET